MKQDAVSNWDASGYAACLCGGASAFPISYYFYLWQGYALPSARRSLAIISRGEKRKGIGFAHRQAAEPLIQTCGRVAEVIVPLFYCVWLFVRFICSSSSSKRGSLRRLLIRGSTRTQVNPTAFSFSA